MLKYSIHCEFIAVLLSVGRARRRDDVALLAKYDEIRYLAYLYLYSPKSSLGKKFIKIYNLRTNVTSHLSVFIIDLRCTYLKGLPKLKYRPNNNSIFQCNTTSTWFTVTWNVKQLFLALSPSYSPPPLPMTISIFIIAPHHLAHFTLGLCLWRCWVISNQCGSGNVQSWQTVWTLILQNYL